MRESSSRGSGPSVTAVLASDVTLTERQRQSLLEIYAAFQSENANHRGRIGARL